jgi:hypothetical protein
VWNRSEKREIYTDRGVAEEIGRKVERRRQISSEVEHFKLSVTPLGPFSILSLIFPLLFYFFLVSFSTCKVVRFFIFFLLPSIRMNKYL